jgi:hypothetical protein
LGALSLRQSSTELRPLRFDSGDTLAISRLLFEGEPFPASLFG